VHYEAKSRNWGAWYDKLLVNCAPFTVLTFLAVVVGGMIQIIPAVVINKASSVEDRIQKVYTPLELAGRDIYIREGCYLCHSQMIRTLKSDIMRYGDYSRLGESIYDHPYQWGSRRIGPDLARVGGKYNDSWHFLHMRDPRATSPDSNMPVFTWLYEWKTDVAALPKKIAVQRMIGVPFAPMTPEEIQKSVAEQSASVAKDLRKEGNYIEPDREIVALIAYLQQLGKYEKVNAKGLAKP
jgi:cytochrome c oxidase cbb3-type subunit I/II